MINFKRKNKIQMVKFKRKKWSILLDNQQGIECV